MTNEIGGIIETTLRPAIRPAAAPQPWFLSQLHPMVDGERLLESLPLTIGRDPSCDIVMHDGSISRVHACIALGAQDLILRDLESKNGTFLNRRRVKREAPLGAGDVIRLGQIVFYLGRRPAEHVAGEPSARTPGPLVGGPSLSGVHRCIRLLGPTDLRILLTGESGTGKELVARELHRQSGRPGPFVAVNCAALPEALVESELFGYVRGAFTGAGRDKPGLFEAAREGTLFLDEVTELPLTSQAKLLRVVETGELRRIGAVKGTVTDCRVISATNRDLERDIVQQRFRADLAARLAEAQIGIPPLRERIEDLPLLIDHLASRARVALTLSAEAVEILACYPWPLNVRELDNAVRTLEVLAQGKPVEASLLPVHLAADPRRAVPADRPATKADRVIAALRENEGNIRLTSQQLGVSRSFIYRCLDRRGIDPAALRAGTEHAF